MTIKRIAFLVLLLAFIIGCDKSATKIELSDQEFVDFISSDGYYNAIAKIDSLGKTDNCSDHQMGILYYEKGRNLGHLEKDVEAVASLKKALELFEKENDLKFIAKTNMLLGNSNAFLSKTKIASEHTLAALELFKKIGDKRGEAKALNSLGHLQLLSDNSDKALKYVIQASAIQLKINEYEELSATYNNIGYIYEQIEDYEAAKEYYQKAILLNKENDRPDTNALRNLGYLHLNNNEIDTCRLLYLKALKVEEQTGKLSIQKEIYDVLLEASIKDKSFENSFEYIKKRDSVNELLVKWDNGEKIKMVENQYELIAKEKELEQEKNTNGKNKIIFAVVIGLLMFLGLFLFQKNKNTKLKLHQEKLLLEQKMLRTQMNPHFVFNALTAIQKTIFDDDPLKSSTYLTRFAKLIRQNFEFVNKKLITLEEDLDALKNYIDTQQLRFENKFDYEINVAQGIQPSFVKIPPMLLQPFIENAIEHGLKPKKEKGLLQVNISDEGKFKRIEIIDNGVGYHKSKVKDDREHAIDIFLKRLKLRNLGEENLFSIQAIENGQGTKVSILLNLNQ